ncbi:MAG TPA: peptidoglycan-binding domain-containing protein [Bryobacteraceae bacterium]|nr:peptidoglycan-binding domain-containing protein [Bryobacteraceae bacterium]
MPTKSKSRRSVAPTHTYRSYQSAPTPERYAQIQQALHDKGFYNGQVNGAWGSDSIDALRRFQSAQNLEPDGKIGSLSLIALGLGPKRLTAQAKPDQAKPADTQSKQDQ